VGLTNLGSESETCVGSRVHLVGAFISFEKNFYRLPFTPPLSGSPYRSFIHPVLKDSAPKPYCELICYYRMNRCLPVGSSGATTPVMTRLCLVQTEHRIDRRSNQPYRQFIRCNCLLLLCLFHSSDTCRNWTFGPSDDVFCCSLCVFNYHHLNLSYHHYRTWI
jgi:hypothetical protein